VLLAICDALMLVCTLESETEGDRRCRMGAALPLSANRAASGHVHYSRQETGNNSRMTASTSNSMPCSANSSLIG
jgi:hypothetical protein